MTPQETLHSILLDAKARTFGGFLLNDNSNYCRGLCGFVLNHKKKSIQSDMLFCELIDEHKLQNNWLGYVGVVGDFNDPKRLALLDWLIERTAP
jgi:hypothetical protein